MDVREISKDSVFFVELEENPSTGYVWKLENPDKFTVLKQELPFGLNPSETIGRTVRKIWHIKANELGEHTIHFTLRRPWEKNSKPIKEYKEVIRAV